MSKEIWIVRSAEIADLPRELQEALQAKLNERVIFGKPYLIGIVDLEASLLLASRKMEIADTLGENSFFFDSPESDFLLRQMNLFPTSARHPAMSAQGVLWDEC